VAIIIDVTERKLELERERELREQFVNTLSHDLRNPLSAAKTTAQLIGRFPDRVDRIPNLVGRIGDSLTRAEKMIEDLLDANRIRAGKGLPVVREETNLVEIANEVCAELGTVHGDRFKKNFPKELIGHWSSKNIYRLLENLLSNAIKYGYSNTEITLTLEDHGNGVDILVHNLGEAIPPEEQKSLFNPFMRSKSVDSEKKRGWGLGLTLVKGVAEAHGGNVSVRSDPKNGTTFKVYLPKDVPSKS
jgi:signal transduction histidine kinase